MDWGHGTSVSSPPATGLRDRFMLAEADVGIQLRYNGKRLFVRRIPHDAISTGDGSADAHAL
jgi:hypothetical protein